MSNVTTISMTITKQILKQIDELVKRGEYTNRSEALRDAAKLLLRLDRGSFKGKYKKEQLTEEDKAQAYESFRKKMGWS